MGGVGVGSSLIKNSLSSTCVIFSNYRISSVCGWIFFVIFTSSVCDSDCRGNFNPFLKRLQEEETNKVNPSKSSIMPMPMVVVTNTNRSSYEFSSRDFHDFNFHTRNSTRDTNKNNNGKPINPENKNNLTKVQSQLSSSSWWKKSLHSSNSNSNAVSKSITLLFSTFNNHRDIGGSRRRRIRRRSFSSSMEVEAAKDNAISGPLLQRERRKSSMKNNNKKIRMTNGRKTLTILGLFELSYGDNQMGRESGLVEKAAAEMALDDINENVNILPNYYLNMHTNDTQCDPGAGVDAFFHALYMRKDTKIISLLGTACSEVTERLAKVATHQRIVQVSFGSTSPSLSDRKEFPLFYRTVAPVSSHAEAIIELIRYFNWDTVSFFTQNENTFTMPVNHLAKDLEEKGNITSKATLTFSISDYGEQLEVMKKELDSRIIIASFGEELAPFVFCEVFRKEMYGPDYAWILIGKPERDWWKDNVSPNSTKRNSPSHNNNRNNVLSPNENEIHTNTTSEPYMWGNVRREGGLIGKVDKSEKNKNLRMAMGKKQCNSMELTKVMENTLVVDRFNVINRISEFGLTTEAFSRRLKRLMNLSKETAGRKLNGDKEDDDDIENGDNDNDKESKETSQFAPESYDAVWAVALGLKHLEEKYNYSLEDFNYMDDEFSRDFNQEIGSLRFTGISGPISFSGSDRIGITSFMQIQGGKLQQIGLYHPEKSLDKLELFSCFQCSGIKWPGNQVPIARREFRIKVIRVEDSLYAIVTIVAFLGILLAVSFLAFNLYYRKLKYIKLSSPRLNNVVIIGCIFAYVAVIILGFDFGPAANGKRFSYICTIRAYLLSMAFSLAFGAMFAKTYRVHRIFTRSCIGVVKNKLLKDTQLMTLIMALLLIDVIIVTSWAVFDPMHQHLRNLTLQLDPEDRSVVYQPQIEVCQSHHGHIWLSCMYGYKSLLLVVGIYMAWETRHVKIQALNDSKNIAYCVYIVVLTSILAVTLANLISERVTLSFVSVTTLILTSTTTTLCLLFLPKIHAIKTGRHKGDPVVESMGLKIEFNTRRLVAEDAKELMFRAEVQNRVYKRQIEAIDVEIWRLENLLLCSSNSSLASIDNLRRQQKQIQIQSQNQNQGPSTLNPNATATTSECGEEGDAMSSTEDNSGSEIYTVYLHGPRFIVPISVLNFQNPNAQPPKTSSAGAGVGSTLNPNAAGIPAPRSSWPNVRSLLTPNNGFISNTTRKYRYKSEPKLVIDEASAPGINTSQIHDDLVAEAGTGNLAPRVTFDDGFGYGDGDGYENFMMGSTSGHSSRGHSPNTVKSSRKSSSTSVGPGPAGSKRSSLIALLKQPFAYFSGVVLRSSAGGGSANGNSPAQGGMTDMNNSYRSYYNYEIDNYDTNNPQRMMMNKDSTVFHLNVPHQNQNMGDGSGRQKFNSVPDLWAVRSSPPSLHLQQNKKKSSILSDSAVIVDSNLKSNLKGYLFSSSAVDNRQRSRPMNHYSGLKSASNPVLRLTVTSDESPYL